MEFGLHSLMHSKPWTNYKTYLPDFIWTNYWMINVIYT